MGQIRFNIPCGTKNEVELHQLLNQPIFLQQEPRPPADDRARIGGADAGRAHPLSDAALDFTGDIAANLSNPISWGGDFIEVEFERSSSAVVGFANFINPIRFINNDSDGHPACGRDIRNARPLMRGSTAKRWKAFSTMSSGTEGSGG